MQNNSLLLGAALLIVGLGLGYCIGTHCFTKGVSEKPLSMREGMHRMPDGTMMGSSAPTMNMADMMASMNTELLGKSGDAFDKAFLSEMTVHHQGAVEMAKLALTQANHKEIKDLANAIIAAQNKEIAQMKSWGEKWYGEAK